MWIFIALLVTAISAAVAVRRMRSRRPAYVIGEQLADAAARDRLHRARFQDLPSPLPALQYSQGEITLLDPQVSDLDQQLRSICTRVAGASAAERADFRNGATGDDFYTLMNFARRAAVFALRDRDGKWIECALTAVATIDALRVDERDLPMTLSLVHHAAVRLHLRPHEMFDAAAALAEGPTAEILRSFVRMSASDKDIESSWGYQEIEGPAGAGFAQRDFEDYNPTRDLPRTALAVREAMRRDRYEADITLATELPSVWFPSAARAKAESILAQSVATVSVRGSLRPGQYEQAGAQTFLVFIVETRSEGDAASLEELAGAEPLPEHAMIALRAGPLFALAVARSWVVGVSSYETGETLRRFEGPFRAALQAAR